MPTIRHRRATKSFWSSQNPVLGAGELGFEIGVGGAADRFKIGNGLSTWDQLEYFINESEIESGGNSAFVAVTSPNVARPTNSAIVVWVGGAIEPVNMADGDLWFSADTIPPTKPTNLSSSAITATGFTLSWTPSTDDVSVTAYGIFLAQTRIATVYGSSYTLSGLSASTAYSVSVVAEDSAGNVSERSTALSVTTSSVDTTAPSKPAGLAASAVGSRQFTISWSLSTDNVLVTGYRVLIDGVEHATTSGASMDVTGKQPNTPYSVTVQARDAAGNWSAASNPLVVTTGASALHRVFTTPPSGLSAQTDGQPNIVTSTAFYTVSSAATGWRVIGGRIYIPAGMTGLSNVSVMLYKDGIQDANRWGPNAWVPNLAVAPIETKTITSPIAGAWNEVTWTTPLTIAPGERVSIASDLRDGKYVYAAIPEDPILASNTPNLYLAEHLGRRSAFRIGSNALDSGGGSVWYGHDIIVDEGV